MNLGQSISMLRQYYGLNQTDVGKHLAGGQPQLSRIESGEHSPTIETLSKIASIIGVPVQVLVWFSIESSDIDFKLISHFDAIEDTLEKLILSIIKPPDK